MISPKAIALITSVAACEPELPPEEIIKGTNNASTTAFAISFSKNPIAVAVSISPTNKTVSQTTLFFIIEKKGIVEYGSSNASTPPSF